MYTDSGLLSDYDRAPTPRGRRARRHSSGLYPSQNQRGRPPASRPYLFDEIDDMVFGRSRRNSTLVAERYEQDEPVEHEDRKERSWV